ncbi:MAG: gliding motility-associated C-terminal domain-containing protein [Saprospiraceae bacterium]|nr:gliding motility-associated C-terminal domain-containing protein [Saprospiraceae bacterium]
MIDALGIKSGLLLTACIFVSVIQGDFSYSTVSKIYIEDCTNGLDDDRDGWTDLNDPDCICTQAPPLSLIPNPSFEDNTCCPRSRSQLNCAVGWIQASDATTDYLNTCGWMGPEEFAVPTPIPDGDGFVGFRDGRVANGGNSEPGWKEYAGACLISPLKANTTYRFEFFLGFSTADRSPSIEISFFGTADCKYLPFGSGNDQFGCPTNGANWEYLGSRMVESTGRPNWVKTGVEITPKRDMAAVAIGPACTPSSNLLSTYYYFDNLVLADSKSFPPVIAAAAHPCSKDYSLQVSNKSNVEFQWYKNGVALVGETGRVMRNIPGEGNYQVRIVDGGDCMVSEKFEYKIPRINNAVNVTLCKGSTYTFGGKALTQSGNYSHTFKSVNDCDSTVNLNLNILGDLRDTISAKILKGDTYHIENYTFKQDGRHMALLSNRYGCDSLVVLDLEYLRIVAPNIIRSGASRGNDIFKPNFDQEEISAISFRFYDRWGNLVHEGFDWDGKTNGGLVAEGVYIYQGTVTLKSGTQKQIYGDVIFMK